MGMFDRRKNSIEMVEKLLLIATLVISIAVSAYHGVGWFQAKTRQADAEKDHAEALQKESTRRKELLETLGGLYVKQLEQIGTEIEKIDDELKRQPWKDSLAGQNLMQVRLEKAKDRQEILEKLGAQLLELRRLANQPSEVRK